MEPRFTPAPSRVTRHSLGLNYYTAMSIMLKNSILTPFPLVNVWLFHSVHKIWLSLLCLNTSSENCSSWLLLDSPHARLFSIWGLCPLSHLHPMPSGSFRVPVQLGSFSGSQSVMRSVSSYSTLPALNKPYALFRTQPPNSFPEGILLSTSSTYSCNSYTF